MERGFAQIVVIIVILAVVGAAATFFTAKKSDEPAEIEDISQPAPLPAPITEIPRPAPVPSSLTLPVKTVTPSELRPSKTSPPSSPQPTPLPLTPPPQPKTSSKISDIEREITILFESGNLIGPEHYTRLASGLDREAALSADAALIETLRNMLESINPHAIDSVSSPSSSSTSPSSQICDDDIKPQLVADITDFSKIQKITAPGSSSSEGPKGHSFVWTGGTRVPVYAPIAMTLDFGAYVKDNAESPAQYLLFFIVNNTCNYQVKFDHIDEPISAIREQLPSAPALADSRTTRFANKIQFRAGDLIGYTAGNLQSGNWDFGFYYMKEKGVLGTQYGSYGVHGYAVCWVDFYTEEKEAQYRRLLEGPKLLCDF